MTNAILVYVTYPSSAAAEELSYKLLQNRLVACANILPQMTSMYLWNDDIEKESEVAVLYKTQKMHFRRVRDFIVSNHSYDTPCVVSWDLSAGNGEFLNWINKQTEVMAK